MSWPPISQIDVDVAEEVHGAHHVSDGLDDVHVREHRLLEHVRGVAGGAEADALERRALAHDVVVDVLQQLLGVLDRIALGELVGLAEDLAVFVDHHGLRRGRATVETDHAAHDLTGAELRRHELRDLVGLDEGEVSPAFADSGGPACSPRRARRPLVMKSCERGEAEEATVGVAVGDAVHAPRRTPRTDPRSRARRSALRPARPSGSRSRGRARSRGCASASTRARTAGKCWGRRAAAPSASGVAARQHAQVLQDDRVGERVEHLVLGDARSSPGSRCRSRRTRRTWPPRGAASSRRSGAPSRSPARRPTLIMHLSMVAPVPDAHLSFMEVPAVFWPVFLSSLNMMILASWPPSSITLSTSGCLCSTASVTAFTSCTNLAPVGATSGPEPEPVRNMRKHLRIVIRESRSRMRVAAAPAPSPAASCGAAGNRARGSCATRLDHHRLDGGRPDVHTDYEILFGHRFSWNCPALTDADVSVKRLPRTRQAIYALR